MDQLFPERLSLEGVRNAEKAWWTLVLPLFLQSFRARKEHLWFLVASFLDFVAGEIGKMPTGICGNLPSDFSIWQTGPKGSNPQRERACSCEFTCAVGNVRLQIQKKRRKTLGISALRSINYFQNHEAESCLCLLLLFNSCWQWHADYEMC